MELILYKGVNTEYEISFTGSNSKGTVFFCTKVCCHENRTVWLPRTGTNTERSDVDIAIYGGDFDSFYWDVKENIHSLLMFDVVQAGTSISDELKKEIEKDGVVLYEKA